MTVYPDAHTMYFLPCSEIPPRQESVLRMFLTAHQLSSQIVCERAAKKLRRLWSSMTIPDQSSEHWVAGHIWQDAVIAIDAARSYNVSSLLKNAFYELVRSGEFWDMLLKDRVAISLSEADIRTLYHARHGLLLQWRLFAVEPPCGPSCRPYRWGNCVKGRALRRPTWLAFLLDHPGLDPRDPLCALDTLEDPKNRADLLKKWCAECVDEQCKAWRDAKIRLWYQLDRLLELPTTEEDDSEEEDRRWRRMRKSN